MADGYPEGAYRGLLFTPEPREKDRYWLHLLLFLLTFVSTTYAGVQLAGRLLLYERVGFLAWLGDGLRYSVALMFFLTTHEFGHYFAARYHRVRTSLPYYIPFPFFFVEGIFNIGTFGAVIRIREPIPSTRKLFDIGIAGPLAGFVAVLLVLLYAVITLPPPTYLLDLPGHDALKAYILRFGTFPPEAPDPFTLYVGQTLLFKAISSLSPHMPPMYELYHYPVLFAGWLGLFFTALNLLPVGQLDGGHVIYALFGPFWHAIIARLFVLTLLLSASIGFVHDFGPLLQDAVPYYPMLALWIGMALVQYYFVHRLFAGNPRYALPALGGLILLTAILLHFEAFVQAFGYTYWFLWCLLIVWVIKVDHPPVLMPERLDPVRKLLAVLGIVIFILCFSFKPLYIA